MGLTSDVIRACQWILDNKAKYNIRVANFSLHSQITAPFYLDPLDRAVEQLWFNGVVVVVAAGNYGTPDGPSGVLYSPSDDPFVITVGAVDLGSQSRLADDRIAPWSSWGSTIDGFAKPELSAPGPLHGRSRAFGFDARCRAAGRVAPATCSSPGTSFAAAIVSGAAADVLARHPEFTPDQVKGSLMVTARSMDGSVGLAGGVGEIAADAARSTRIRRIRTPPSRRSFGRPGPAPECLRRLLVEPSRTGKRLVELGFVEQRLLELGLLEQRLLELGLLEQRLLELGLVEQRLLELGLLEQRLLELGLVEQRLLELDRARGRSGQRRSLAVEGREEPDTMSADADGDPR